MQSDEMTRKLTEAHLALKTLNTEYSLELERIASLEADLARHRAFLHWIGGVSLGEVTDDDLQRRSLNQIVNAAAAERWEDLPAEVLAGVGA